MNYDAKAAATAKRLITRFGQPVVIGHATPGAYDPATSTLATAYTNESARGAELAYTSREIDGTVIQAGDKKMLLSAVGITAPAVEDTCTYGGKVWTVKAVSALAPAGLPIIYTLQLRSPGTP